MIYVASPYSDPDPLVREARFEAACHLVSFLCRDGYKPYSPIVHFHPVAIRFDLPLDAAYWQETNFEMLHKAERVVVYQIAGWDTSIGVLAEIEEAKHLGIPVDYIDGMLF
jgi:hypothetical protein